MTDVPIWADQQFWALMVLPIGGAFVGLICWLFFFPSAKDDPGEPRKR